MSVPENYVPGAKAASEYVRDAINSLSCARLELVANKALVPASGVWDAEIYLQKLFSELPDQQEPPHAE